MLVTKSEDISLNSKKKLISEIKNGIEKINSFSEPTLNENVTKLNETVIQKDQTDLLIQSGSELFHFLPKNSDVRCLINDQDLTQVLNRNPWEFNVKKSLEDLQARMYENVHIKFRIGGKAIHSASQIVRAKSFLMIQESEDTNNNLQINEVDEEDLGNPDPFFDSPSEDANLTENDIIANLACNSTSPETTLLAQLAGFNIDPSAGIL